MNTTRVIRISEVLLVFVSFVLITVTVHLTLTFHAFPQVYYVLLVIWLFFLVALFLTFYRQDIEIDTRLYVVRFAYLSANLSQELRKISGSIIRSETSFELEQHKEQVFRAVLNLAHEYYSFIKREYCTANIAMIDKLNDGTRVCRIIQYDDFVPNARREKEVEIPLDNSLFGEIIRRELRAITIDDYTVNSYPIYMTPIIEEGYCLAGICVPIKSFDEVIGFFNVDSMKRNLFKPDADERIASFFGEVLGQLIQTVEYKSRMLNSETLAGVAEATLSDMKHQ